MKLLVKAYGKKNIAELTPKKVLVTSKNKKPYWMMTYIKPDGYYKESYKEKKEKDILSNLRVEIDKTGESKNRHIYWDLSEPITTEELQKKLEGDLVFRIKLFFKNKDGDYDLLKEISGKKAFTKDAQAVKDKIDSLVNPVSENFFLKYKIMEVPFFIQMEGNGTYIIDFDEPAQYIQETYENLKDAFSQPLELVKIRSISINEWKTSDHNILTPKGEEPNYRKILEKEHLNIKDMGDLEKTITPMLHEAVLKNI